MAAHSAVLDCHRVSRILRGQDCLLERVFGHQVVLRWLIHRVVVVITVVASCLGAQDVRAQDLLELAVLSLGDLVQLVHQLLVLLLDLVDLLAVLELMVLELVKYNSHFYQLFFLVYDLQLPLLFLLNFFLVPIELFLVDFVGATSVRKNFYL